MQTDEFNAMTCPIPHCDEPLAIVWECYVDAYADGGFCGWGHDAEGKYGPDMAELTWWKVRCRENEHVVLTAHDEWPGCWEAVERGEVLHTDEQGWDFDIDRLRAHIEAMQRALAPA